MFAVASLFLLVVPSVFAFNQKDFLYDLRKTRSLAAAGSEAEAISYWERLWPIYGGSFGRYEFELATLYSNAGFHGKAEKAYLDSIELRPNSPRPYVGLSFVYLEQQRYAEAKKWARRAVYEYPKLSIGYTTVGHVEWKHGKFASARTWLEKSLEVWPQADTYWLLAIVTYELKDWQATIDSMEAAIRLDRRYMADENGMRVATVSLARIGRYRDAYRMIETLRTSNPGIRADEIESLFRRVKEMELASSIN